MSSGAWRPPHSMKAKISAMFAACYGRSPKIIARAPGRIEFVGNHTDYNGGSVLGAAIDRGIWVALAPRKDERWRFMSEAQGRIVAMSTGHPRPQTGSRRWTNYPLGVIAAFPQFGLCVPGGFDLLVISNLPTGAGLSSSAALELASALAFLALTEQDASLETIVKIGRHAENNFVGVPCGILDQGVSGFGKKDRLVFIDCRGPRFATVPLPAGVQFWIFNTHTKHALVDGLYAARHRECMAAARALGVSQLADVTSAQLKADRVKLAPQEYIRAKHVIEEIARVGATIRALRAGNLTKVGTLLTASHRSSQTLFENSTPELDFLVDTLISTPQVHGARLTGGGFGGAVMALTTARFSLAQARAVAKKYAKKFGATPDILHTRTDDGALLLT